MPDGLVRELFIRQHDGVPRAQLRTELRRSGLTRKEITVLLDNYKNTPDEYKGLVYHLFKRKN